MINLSVHSQNLRGSLKNCIDNLHNRINNLDCECTAICLQDLGPTGPDGPPLLRQSLGEHSIFVNSKSNNKSRTVAIIVHKSWAVNQVYRDPAGSAVGVVASRSGTEILMVSAYLPASLDVHGTPD